MRLGLRLADDGIATFWVDEESNIQPAGLRSAILSTDGPVAILVDDGDLWGATVSRWARELPGIKPGVLFAVAVRSTRLEGVLDRDTLGFEPIEISMPHLTDIDIDSLIGVLDRENRLGVLKGLSHEERVAAFRKEAGRQLLVAMIQATSGKLFREKVLEEFQELSPLQRQIYATLCLVSSQRWTMDRQEIILACGSLGNEILDAVESLARRNVIARRDIHSNYGARHRVIADEIVHAMEFRQYMATVLEGVCFAFASGVNSGLPRNNRLWRRLIRFLNHQFILQVTTPDIGRQVYENVEQLLQWDYHYWLQRASLEVEQGDLDLATNFLDQARSISPGERTVETEYAYLLIKRASKTPEHGSAEEWFTEGRKYLEELIGQSGSRDSYPYHVLGSQGLAWARQATIPLLEKTPAS